MKIACLTIIAMIFLSDRLDAGALQDQDETIINSYIARQAKQERGDEYKDARKIISGDLNHDGIPDTTVLYTIEGQGGSNNYLQYLAVFVRAKATLEPMTHAIVGGKGIRSVDLIDVSDNTIDLATLSYLPSDASCCPSKKGKTRYTLVGRKLKELRNSQAKRA